METVLGGSCAGFQFLTWGEKQVCIRPGIILGGVRNCLLCHINSESTGSLEMSQTFFLVEPPSYFLQLNTNLQYFILTQVHSQIHVSSSVWLYLISMQPCYIYVNCLSLLLFFLLKISASLKTILYYIYVHYVLAYF